MQQNEFLFLPGGVGGLRYRMASSWTYSSTCSTRLVIICGLRSSWMRYSLMAMSPRHAFTSARLIQRPRWPSTVNSSVSLISTGLADLRMVCSICDSHSTALLADADADADEFPPINAKRSVAMLLAPDWLALAAAPPKLDDEYEKDMFFFLCLRFKRKLFDFTWWNKGKVDELFILFFVAQSSKLRIP